MNIMKAFLALMVNISIHAADADSAEKYKISLNHLKFALCHNHLDGHMYGIYAVQKAQEQAQQIHDRLKALVNNNVTGNNFQRVVQSLDKDIDAPIVHQCGIIEKSIRETGQAAAVYAVKAWSIKGGVFGMAEPFSGEIFYKNAASFDDYYKTLSNEQLDQLIAGTKPPVCKYFS
jgi:hypothetical protein